MYLLPLFYIFILSHFAHGATITARATIAVRAPAITPSAPGEIGVNPVDEGLGSKEDYVAPIGDDTSFLSFNNEASTTKWIGVNNEYLTEVVITTTVNNAPKTTKTKVHIAVSTAKAAAAGIAAGDVTVLLTESLRVGLEDIAKTAVKACGLAAKHRKRQGEVLACIINAAVKAAETESVLDIIAATDLAALSVELAAGAGELTANAYQLLKTQAIKNKFALIMASILAGGYYSGAGDKALKKVPGKLKFPGGKLGDENFKPSPTKTSSACDPKRTPDEHSPGCDDEDCKGIDRKCTTGKDKGCVCLEAVQNYIEEHYDKEFFDLQRNLFEQALKDLPDSAPPSCFRNSHGDNFEGNPKASPSDWCVCTSGISQGKYSTIAGKDPCALKTMPTQTITIKDLQPINTQDPTSCRLVEPKTSSLAPYCTCNDDKRHGSPIERTTIIDGATKTSCVPKSTGKPLCGNFGGSYFHENQPQPFLRTVGKDAIEKYCGLQNRADLNQDFSFQPYYYLLEENFGWPGMRFWYGQNDLYCRHEHLFMDSKLAKAPDALIDRRKYWDDPGCTSPLKNWVTLGFNWSDDQNGCPPKKRWGWPKGKEWCYDKLIPLLDDCNTDTRQEKWGGVFRVRTDSGCLDMFLFSGHQTELKDKKMLPKGKPDASNQIEVANCDSDGGPSDLSCYNKPS